MAKRQAIEWDEESDYEVKDEPPTSPPPVTPPKKPRNTTSSITSTPSTSTPNTSPNQRQRQKQKQKLSPGSSATSKKEVYMEMIFEAGLKAINKKAVQDETGLSPAQQAELIRKDKGALRRAVSGFVAGL